MSFSSLHLLSSSWLAFVLEGFRIRGHICRFGRLPGWLAGAVFHGLEKGTCVFIYCFVAGCVVAANMEGLVSLSAYLGMLG